LTGTRSDTLNREQDHHRRKPSGRGDRKRVAVVPVVKPAEPDPFDLGPAEVRRGQAQGGQRRAVCRYDNWRPQPPSLAASSINRNRSGPS
jgi:hypothetical protein